MTVRTGLLLFDGFDLLDVGGPYEVLLTANRCAAEDSDDAPFHVTTVGLTAGPVTAYGGMEVVPTIREGDVGALDLLVVPGAVDVDAVIGDEELLAALADLCTRTDVVASVCTGAFLLAAVGLLRGRAATTHHEDLDGLAGHDVGEVVGGVRWVDAGDVVTGAGLSSGIDMALHLVHRFAGAELAAVVARKIEHDWDAGSGRDVA